MRRAALLLALLLALTAGTAATAGAATPRTSFYAVEAQVMCVTCNVPLSNANSPQAARQKAEIRRLVATGLTEQQVLDRLVDEYGPNVLADPPASGVSLLSYAVPVGGVLLLLALGALLLPRWRRNAAARARAEALGPVEPELSDEDALRLDRDLGRLRV